MNDALQDLDRRIKLLEKTCCSMENIKEQAVMVDTVKRLSKEIELLIQRTNTLYKFLYIGTGIYAVIQVLGVKGFISFLQSLGG